MKIKFNFEVDINKAEALERFEYAKSADISETDFLKAIRGAIISLACDDDVKSELAKEFGEIVEYDNLSLEIEVEGDFEEDSSN